MSTTAINGGVPAITTTVGAPTTGGLNPADSKVSEAASSALKGANGPDGGSSLLGRADSTPVGRTWPQFRQLVASYLTFGWVRASMPRVPSVEIATVNAIPESVGPLVEERPRAPSNPPPAPTLVSRAWDAIKSVFTAIYNMLFGARSA